MQSMDTAELAKLLNKGYYVTLGSIAVLLETVQSPQKRTQVTQEWQTNLTNLIDELTTKGVATESEARSYVDNMVSKQVQTVDTTATTVATTVVSAVVGDEISELKNLTKQLADLRSELERSGQ